MGTQFTKLGGIFPFVLVKSSNLLERQDPTRRHTSDLTKNQTQVDQAIGGFIHHATDWRSLAALTIGGLAYRLGRMGMAGIESGKIVRTLSFGAGLSAEVLAFEGTHRSLHSVGANLVFARHGGRDGRSQGSPLNSENPNLWRWSGPGGLKQGLLQSLITFSTLKATGRLTRSQNLILQHGAQDLAMVAGHQLVYKAGIAPQPEDSFLHQMLHAEATLWQLKAGVALSHSLSGERILGLERALDFSLPFRMAGHTTSSPMGSNLSLQTAGGIRPEQNRKIRPLALLEEGSLWKMVKKKDQEKEIPSQRGSETQNPFTQALKIKEKFAVQEKISERDFEDFLNDACTEMEGILPFLKTNKLEALAGQFEPKIDHENNVVRRWAIIALASIVKLLPVNQRLAWVFKFTKKLGGDQTIQPSLLIVLGGLVASLKAKDRLAPALKVAEQFGHEKRNVNDETYMSWVEHIAPALSNRQRMELTQSLLKNKGLNDFPIGSLIILLNDMEGFKGVSPARFVKWAAERNDPDLEKLAAYYEFVRNHPQFWRSYLEAPDPLSYLKMILSQVDQYRRGKILTEFTERELFIAHASLDRWSDLSFKDFKKLIWQEPPPPPFLNRPFQAVLSRGIKVELIPTKSQTDLFLIFPRSGLRRERETFIYHKDFQTYRILINGGFLGIIFLQKVELAGKKILAMAIDLQEDRYVHPRNLFEVIKENFSQLAFKQRFDCILMSRHWITSSSSLEMQKVIEDQNYEILTLNTPIAGPLFEANEFLVMWKKE